PKFDARAVWERLASGQLSLFMAVPTIYARLISAWEQVPESEQQRYSEGCRQMRLMVSGSAALPVSTLERWRSISGQTLLERYGMTEIGMGLSNPLEGERVPGSGVMFIGTEGMMFADYGSYRLFPAEKFTGFKAPEPTIPKSIGHHAEWIKACKEGTPTTCNFDYSGALSEAVLLGNVAFRAGKPLEWDAENLKATN
ncbi:MAG: AMP-binding protein, partial [Pirellulaceae bacterium]|nr:AMP-binding protein [Pirellulaceae bacterium]